MFAEFGDPVNTDAYSICVYDNSALELQADLPAGGTCAGKPCWKGKAPKSFKYKDKPGTPNGIQKFQLRAGDAGKSKVQAKGKGIAVPDVMLPFDLPVIVQVQRQGAAECWESEFDSAGVSKNEAAQFKGKATGP